MIFTPRSIAVGLVAWLLAVLIVCLGKVNPTQLGALAFLILALGLITGFVAVVVLSRRFCRYNSERVNAVMVFALTYLVGIFAPMAAIWANVPFYSWAVKQQAPPRSDILAPKLVAAIERTSVSFYLGMAVLTVLGLVVARWISATAQAEQTEYNRSCWRLSWIDGASSLMIFLLGLGYEIGGLTVIQPIRFRSLAAWVGYIGLAFLATFLIRSLRLQATKLRTQISSEETVPPPHPWRMSQLAVQFAIRCGLWTGLAVTLLLAGCILTPLAEKELNDAGAIPTPFASTVSLLRPLFRVAAAPSLGVLLTPFAILAVLPRSTRIRERILVCAQGGAAAGVVPGISLFAQAIGLGKCCATVLPTGDLTQLHTPAMYGLLADGQWIPLAGIYLICLICLVAGGAILWALLAAVGCVFASFWTRVCRKLQRV